MLIDNGRKVCVRQDISGIKDKRNLRQFLYILSLRFKLIKLHYNPAKTKDKIKARLCK